MIPESSRSATIDLYRATQFPAAGCTRRCWSRAWSRATRRSCGMAGAGGCSPPCGRGAARSPIRCISGTRRLPGALDRPSPQPRPHRRGLGAARRAHRPARRGADPPGAGLPGRLRHGAGPRADPALDEDGYAQRVETRLAAGPIGRARACTCTAPRGIGVHRRLPPPADAASEGLNAASDRFRHRTVTERPTRHGRTLRQRGPGMDFHRRFTVLMCTPAFDPDDLEGARVNQIVAAVEQRGFEVCAPGASRTRPSPCRPTRRWAASWSIGASAGSTARPPPSST